MGRVFFRKILLPDISFFLSFHERPDKTCSLTRSDPVYFERYEVHGDMKRIPEEVMESIKKNRVCLKGGLRTPVGGVVSSINVQLRKELDLYASLVNCFNMSGLPTRHEGVDIH
ncbi:hypothetical protein MLD38_013610 [Melastoma candidum]|uniref:Uncharacterized protein n=1 Tax=Melastoma candidum TaxID=119954 RepID=A0ACB9REC0_9MYRT|nr:hypothetical protein MLD38_013610 [Melastoma candidum]